MDEEKQFYTIILRHDTSTEWMVNDPILAFGEYGVEDDTHRLKRGDGDTPWSELPYEEMGLSYLISYENLLGDVSDNEALKNALLQKVDKASFEDVSNKVVAGLELVGETGTITKITKLSKNVVTNNTISNVLYIKSSDNSLLGYWSIDDLGVRTLDLRAKSTIPDYEAEHVYYADQLCYYNNTLYRAVEDFVSGQDFDPTKWVVITSLNAKEVKYDNRTSRLDSTNVKDAIDEVVELDNAKVKKTTRANKVYGTDDNGEQLLYDKDDLRTVDTVNGIQATANKNVQLDADDINYDDEAETKKSIRDILDSKVDKTVAGRNEKIVKDFNVSYGAENGSIEFNKTMVSLEDGSIDMSRTMINVVSEDELTAKYNTLNTKIDNNTSELRQLVTDTSNTLDRKIDRTKSELEDTIDDTSVADRAYTDTAKGDMLDALDSAETRLNTRITNVNTTLQTNIDTVAQTAQTNLTNAVDDINADITTKYNRLDGKIDSTATTLQSNIDTNYNTLNTKINNYKTQTDAEIAEGLALKINKSIADSLVSSIEVAIDANNPTFKIVSKNTNSGNATTNHLHFVSRGNIAITTVDEDHIQFDVSAIDTINANQETHLDAIDTSLTAIGTRLSNHDTRFASVDTQLTNMDTAIHTNSEAISDLQDDLTTLTSDMEDGFTAEATARSTKDTELENSIATNAQAIADINTEISTTIETEISDLETALQTETTNRTTADTNLSQALTTNVNALTDRIVAIETVDATQNTTLTEHASDIADLQAEDILINTAISDLNTTEQNDVSALNTRITNVDNAKVDKSIFSNVDNNVVGTSEIISNNGLYGIVNSNVCVNGANYGTVTQNRIDFTSSDDSLISTIVRDENDNIISIDLRTNLDTDVNYFLTSQTLNTSIGAVNYILVSSITPTDKQNVEVQDIISDSHGTWARVTAIGRVDEQDRPIVLATTYHRQAAAVWGTITGNINDQADLGVKFSNVAQSITSLSTLKVDKISTANRIYGTDNDGNQTSYSKESLGNVDTVNSVLPDVNKNVVVTGEDIPVTRTENPFSLYSFLSRGIVYDVSTDLTKQRVLFKGVAISPDKGSYRTSDFKSIIIKGGNDGASNTSIINVALANVTDPDDNVAGPEYTLTVNPNNIPYDNAISGLSSSTMKTAIDELTTLDGQKVTTTTYNTKMTSLDNSIASINTSIGTLTTDLATANTNIATKVTKTSSADKIYGTDASGEQTTYNKTDFGKVDTVNNVLPDNNKNITITGKDIEYSSSKSTKVSNIINNLVDIGQSGVSTDNNALVVTMKTATTVDAQQSDIYNIAGNNDSDIIFSTGATSDIINAKVNSANVDVTVGLNSYKLQTIINTLNTNLSNLQTAFDNIKKVVSYVQGASLKAGDFAEITSSNNVVYLAKVVANYTADSTKATAEEGFRYDVEQGNLTLIGIPEQV